MNTELLDKYNIRNVQIIGEIGDDYYLFIHYNDGYETRINVGKDYKDIISTDKLNRVIIKNSSIHYRKEKLKKILNG